MQTERVELYKFKKFWSSLLVGVIQTESDELYKFKKGKLFSWAFCKITCSYLIWT